MPRCGGSSRFIAEPDETALAQPVEDLRERVRREHPAVHVDVVMSAPRSSTQRIGQAEPGAEWRHRPVPQCLPINGGPVVFRIGNLPLGGPFQALLVCANDVHNVRRAPVVVERVAAVGHGEVEGAARGEQRLELLQPRHDVGDVLGHVSGDDQVEPVGDRWRELVVLDHIVDVHDVGDRSIRVVLVPLAKFIAAEPVEVPDIIAEVPDEGRAVQGPDLQD